LLETFLKKNGEIFLENAHFSRLKNSAKFFKFNFPEKKIRENFRDFCEKFSEKKSWKIRLKLQKNGEYFFSGDEIFLEKFFLKKKIVKISAKKLDSKNFFLAHKNSKIREFYDAEMKKKSPKIFGLIFKNEKNEICEANSSNIFAEIRGEILTPPQKCGLLPGTFRADFLAKKKCREKILHEKDLFSAEKIFFGNSVRGIFRVFLEK